MGSKLPHLANPGPQVHTRVMYSVHRIPVMPVYSVHRIQLGQMGPQTQPHGGTGGFSGGREHLHIYFL